MMSGQVHPDIGPEEDVFHLVDEGGIDLPPPGEKIREAAREVLPVRLRAVRRRPKIPERGGVSGRSEVSEAGGMFAVGRGPGQDGREV